MMFWLVLSLLLLLPAWALDDCLSSGSSNLLLFEGGLSGWSSLLRLPRFLLPLPWASCTSNCLFLRRKPFSAWSAFDALSGLSYWIKPYPRWNRISSYWIFVNKLSVDDDRRGHVTKTYHFAKRFKQILYLTFRTCCINVSNKNSWANWVLVVTRSWHDDSVVDFLSRLKICFVQFLFWMYSSLQLSGAITTTTYAIFLTWTNNTGVTDGFHSICLFYELEWIYSRND